MIRDTVMTVHIVSGGAGLLLGPAFLVTTGRLKTRCGWGYHAAVGGVAISGGALAVISWEKFWWLLPVAVATEVSALLGVAAWHRRRPGSPTRTAHLLGGSYIALVTGSLIASTKNPILWVLPSVVAQWPIAVAKRRLNAQQQLPSARRDNAAV